MVTSDQLVTNSGVPMATLRFNNLVEGLNKTHSYICSYIYYRERERCIEQGKGEIHPNMELLVVFPTWSRG